VKDVDHLRPRSPSSLTPSAGRLGGKNTRRRQARTRGCGRTTSKTRSIERVLATVLRTGKNRTSLCPPVLRPPRADLRTYRRSDQGGGPPPTHRLDQWIAGGRSVLSNRRSTGGGRSAIRCRPSAETRSVDNIPPTVRSTRGAFIDSLRQIIQTRRQCHRITSSNRAPPSSRRCRALAGPSSPPWTRRVPVRCGSRNSIATCRRAFDPQPYSPHRRKRKPTSVPRS